jgi:hypothetical protein
MVKIFIGFWQCILAQILLVCLIDLPFLLFGLTGFGILKIILFLYVNYQYKILPHPTNHYNLFAFAIEKRFPKKNNTKERRIKNVTI